MSNEITLDEFERLIAASDDVNETEIVAQVLDEALLQENTNELSRDEYEQILSNVDYYVLNLPKKTKKIFPIHKMVWWAVACCSIIVPIFFLMTNNSEISKEAVELIQKPKLKDESRVLFGKSSVISLDSLHPGAEIASGGIILTKKADGEISYRNAASDNHEKPFVVSIVTSAKDSYKCTLPDGSKIWLNAQSSLSFPSKFVENERVVNATGELFFEVVPSARAGFKPFVVLSGEQRIRVLGTSFNVQAYSGRPYITTSLIEGKIELTTNNRRIELNPGQESFVENSNKHITIRKFDSERVKAWMKGYFVFNNTALESAIEELSNWYGFEINSNIGRLANEPITATINRNVPIESVLESLEKITSHKFQLKSNRLIIH